MKKRVKFVHASSSDVPWIIKGIKEICYIEKESPDPDQIIKKHTLDAVYQKRIIIAYIDDLPIGFIQFIFSDKLPYGVNYPKTEKYCWIEWLHIDKRYRNRGIGKSLMQQVKEISSKKNVNKIMLDVFEVNKKAQRFYEKIGMKSLLKIVYLDL